MEQAQKEKIIAYLSGPRNYSEGVELYDLFGHNRMYKRRFLLEKSEFTKSLLIEELRKLAGLSEARMRALPRNAGKAKGETKDATINETKAKQKGITPTIKKFISFRDRFPFLNSPECPDELKIVVGDLFTAHEIYKSSFAKMQSLGDNENAATETEQIVENYLRNRELWDILEHYKATGELCKPPAETATPEGPSLAELTDLELSKKLNSARSNQSKQAAKLKQAQKNASDPSTIEEALAKWTRLRAAIEAEIECRKKKS